MITIYNYSYNLQYINIDALPANLKKGYEFAREVTNNHSGYGLYFKNKEIQAKMDTYFKLLTEYMKNQEEISKKVTSNEKQKQSKTQAASKKANSQKTAPQNKPKPVRINYEDGKPVERISDDVKFIKRYLSLHQRVKTKAQILNFINALQRAIFEKRIRKASPYATEIMSMQKQLLTAYKVMKKEERFDLAPTALKRCSEIVGSFRIRTSTQLLKRFVGIQGKYLTKDKAQKLLESVERALKASKIIHTDPYVGQIRRITASLKLFVKNATPKDTLEIHQEALNGINAALGCSDDCQCNKKHSGRSLDGIDTVDQKPEVMSVEEAKSRQYNSVNLAPKWKALLGEICLPTHFFVYGSGGSGKTAFTLLFTQHLADLGYKILYVAGEQFDTPPFTKLLNLLNIVAGPHYQIVGKLETLNPADFDFVVLDTKDSLDIETEEFLALKSRYPEQSFIVVSHGIKGGDFRGKEQWRNIVDVMIQGEHGIIRTGQDKNRWGGAGEILIFDHPSQYQIKD